MFTNSDTGRFARQLLAAAVFTLTVPAVAQTAGDYRSAASGNWNAAETWETHDGAGWVPAVSSPNAAGAGTVTIQADHFVTNSASLTADQIVVATGGTLAAVSTLTIANGEGADLDISGTLLALGGSSVITLQANSEVRVRSGGVFAHNGTSGTCVNNGGGTITFENGGRFLLQRSGGTIPTAVWNSGSTCEVNYLTASTTRPGNSSHGQNFHHFHWNNINQNGGNDLANVLTNLNGDLIVNAGLVGDFREFKLNNSSGGGNHFFGGDIIVNAGRLNWTSGGGPYTWTVRGDFVINEGTAMDVSGSSGGSYTMLLDSGTVQNYTCAGTNLASRLNWTVTAGTTLNLNDNLPLTAAGRILTADGTVNINGNVVSADLIGGSGIIRNQGGGAGILELGAGNGNNTLDGATTLLNGASGTLGLVKRGTGSLVINAAQTFSGGLVVSNGTVILENSTGSATGSGAVNAYGGTLAGNGIIAGAVFIESGAALSPGGASPGRLTVNNGVNLSGVTAIDVDKANGTNDVIVATTINYGGTLNITDLGGGLVPGDTFQIVTAGAHSGDFASIIGSPGLNLGWEFNPAIGVLTVISVGVEPPTLVYSQTGSTLSFSWTEVGYKLQAQTNSLSTGLTSDWQDYPGGDVSPVLVDVDAASGAVFFRLAPAAAAQ